MKLGHQHKSLNSILYWKEDEAPRLVLLGLFWDFGLRTKQYWQANIIEMMLN